RPDFLLRQPMAVDTTFSETTTQCVLELREATGQIRRHYLNEPPTSLLPPVVPLCLSLGVVVRVSRESEILNHDPLSAPGNREIRTVVAAVPPVVLLILVRHIVLK